MNFFRCLIIILHNIYKYVYVYIYLPIHLFFDSLLPRNSTLVLLNKIIIQICYQYISKLYNIYKIKYIK